jgi:putative solute:sodium symporter small subunit
METMWRQLLQYTDTVGRAMVGIAGVLLVVAVVSFVVGIVRASTGLAATTLPFWLTTMGSAVVAGVLVYLASRRGDFRRS